MEGGEEGGGPRLSKRILDGEVDYKSKSGTAWSHNFLNQKPWHPLSYPNQRRKWIAEQTHAQHSRRSHEISREYAQEQEFFRQTALISKKEKEKVEMMQAVSFMYIRPPGYNPESAKAAEIADEMRKEEQAIDGAPSSGPSESAPVLDRPIDEKRKQRPKDVFGRSLPTGEEFEALKNAPRHDTGVQGRAKPFGIEIRNVRCVRCGNYGHQSGDRECPLKDTITPNEQSRIKRDDPLTAIIAHTDPSEPLKWELKQKPGVSPPRGGFKPDDPNQQIVAEDIYDEYGGFLGGGDIPELLANFTSGQKKSKHSKRGKRKRSSSPTGRDSRAYREGEIDKEEKTSKKKKKRKKNKQKEQLSSESSSSGDSDSSRHHRNSKQKHFSKVSEDPYSDTHRKSKKRIQKYQHSAACEDSDSSTSKDSYLEKRHKSRKSRHHYSSSSEDSDALTYKKGKKTKHGHYYSSDDSESIRQSKKEKSRHKHYYSSEDSEPYRHRRSRKGKHRH